jgi:hypothetical protein
MYSPTFVSAVLLLLLMSQMICWSLLAREANTQLEMMRKQAEVAKFEVMYLSSNLRRDSEDRF